MGWEERWGDSGRESSSGREAALNVEKELTGVKDNYRQHLQKVRGSDSADEIRASSHPPVSIPHRRAVYLPTADKYPRLTRLPLTGAKRHSLEGSHGLSAAHSPL